MVMQRLPGPASILLGRTSERPFYDMFNGCAGFGGGAFLSPHSTVKGILVVPINCRVLAANVIRDGLHLDLRIITRSNLDLALVFFAKFVSDAILDPGRCTLYFLVSISSISRSISMAKMCNE